MMVCDLGRMPYLEFVRWSRFYIRRHQQEEINTAMIGR